MIRFYLDNHKLIARGEQYEEGVIESDTLADHTRLDQARELIVAAARLLEHDEDGSFEALDAVLATLPSEERE